ncbi:MAG: NAD(P)-binding domain-containing protein [Pseudomonadota bacterium]
MKMTDTTIIGAGQSGLSMSHALSQRSIDHLVLDRGEIGNSWRTQRWDSLRMLTPNWANGLAGAPYSGSDPDGYMTASEFVLQLEAYASRNTSQVLRRSAVHKVTHTNGGFLVESESGSISSRTVVIATGATACSSIPGAANYLPSSVFQITPDRYRRPSDLPPGGVLVVGASASGVQLARELRLAGHDVILAAGSHVRLPRRYRGMDIEHWLEVTGTLDQTSHDIFEQNRARKLVSAQLMGGTENVDLNALQSLGISVVGRLADIRDGNALFSGGLANLAASADLKMHRFLDLVDGWIAENDVEMPQPDRPGETSLPIVPTLSLPLDNGPIRTVVWATGFVPDFSFLDLPVFNRRGRLIHDGGVCQLPGLYVLGLPFLRRRRSSQISGAAHDAAELAQHIETHLRTRTAA